MSVHEVRIVLLGILLIAGWLFYISRRENEPPVPDRHFHYRGVDRRRPTRNRLRQDLCDRQCKHSQPSP